MRFRAIRLDVRSLKLKGLFFERTNFFKYLANLPSCNPHIGSNMSRLYLNVMIQNEFQYI